MTATSESKQYPDIEVPIQLARTPTTRKSSFKQLIESTIGKTLNCGLIFVLLFALFGSLVVGIITLGDIPNCMSGRFEQFGILTVLELAIPLGGGVLAFVCFFTPTFISPVLLIAAAVGYCCVKLTAFILAIIITAGATDCSHTIAYVVAVAYWVVTLIAGCLLCYC
ncbi:MAG: hypothetical protein K0U52_03710 [Gammaproteobacteria bacterium]|nr:hypothetical protein [Gammaproteobacteria bacterium]